MTNCKACCRRKLTVSCFGVSFKDWDNLTAVAKAFSIGRVEAQAMQALFGNIESSVANELRAAVAQRGMRWFITNDLVGKGCFSTSWTSATGAFEPWVAQLTNASDQKLVPVTDVWSFKKSSSHLFYHHVSL